MQNLMVLFAFTCFRPETPFLVKEIKRSSIIYDLTEVEAGECVRGLFLGTTLKFFK